MRCPDLRQESVPVAQHEGTGPFKLRGLILDHERQIEQIACRDASGRVSLRPTTARWWGIFIDESYCRYQDSTRKCPV